MSRLRPVVLFFPSYHSDEAAPPLALIHLAAPLAARGHEVRVIDSAVEADPQRAVLEALDGACALGVSMVTGPMITQGVMVAAAVRAARPDLPIVAGGWHPSILPDQTLRSPLFDAVVKGQGEITLLEIVKRWNAGERDLSGIAGSFFKRGGEVVANEPRGYTDINALPRRPSRSWISTATRRSAGASAGSSTVRRTVARGTVPTARTPRSTAETGNRFAPTARLMR